MEKLKMQTANVVDENIKRIGEMFPNCLTERLDENGRPEVAIDFDQLRQELSKSIVEGPEERYQFTWPDKRNAIRLANAPTTDTLRPCREESVDFDNTQNLYIEGDNLQVLKLLRENYLGKVKMIYIDPPYNTGNDFVYNDDFAQAAGEYIHNSGQEDEEGNRLVTNTESNGRFHTDWLNMMYPRLKVAKDLLSEDGVILISIDDHEHSTLLNIMNEIYGQHNYIDSIVWEKKSGAKGVPPRNLIVNVHEYIVAYQKSDSFKFAGERRDVEADGFKNPDNDPRGPWRMSNIKSTIKPIEDAFTITDPNTGKQYTNTWAFSKESLERMIKENRIIWKETLPKQKEFLYEMTNENKAIKSSWGVFDAQSTTVFLKNLIPEVLFENPKPVKLMKHIIRVATRKDDLVLDFFSGSSTTAQAIMEVNIEEEGGRKYIMVQTPNEKFPEESKAYKAKFYNICDFAKERIRRAGKKIKEENPLTTQDLDTGFRVLKLDSSNMENVYYTPAEFNEQTLFENNIKGDRTEEDLLFQAMIELGIELSAKIEKQEIAGKTVWSVADNYLLACFDDNVNESTITALAKQKPYYFVMRDASLATDQVADNFEQIWEEYSKDTIRRII
jgi:adenine-specific DNA-methyltransferase